MSAQNEQWGVAWRAQRERARACRDAEERVDAMLGGERAAGALLAALSRGDRDQVLSLVYRLRGKQPEAR